MSAEDVMGPGPDVIIYQWAPQLDHAVGVVSQPNSRRSVDRSKRDEPVDAIIPVWAPGLGAQRMGPQIGRTAQGPSGLQNRRSRVRVLPPLPDKV